MPRCSDGTPRQNASLEADVVNGASAHSQPQTNASATPVVCALSNSATEKHACNSGVTQNSQRAYVHAHCVNGGVGHDHELHPKQPLDQEAIESVARQRESVIRAEADTEVLPPFARDSDQASTLLPLLPEQDLWT